MKYDDNQVEWYNVHDNGGRPFGVGIKKNRAAVIDNETNEILITFKDVLIFVGGSLDNDKELGNSFLIGLDPYTYVFIGHIIYKFKTYEPINEFYSEVSNSDVPYPIALSDKNIYFMLDQKYVPIYLFPKNMVSTTNSSAVYGYFYEFFSKGKKAKRFSGYKLLIKSPF